MSGMNKVFAVVLHPVAVLLIAPLIEITRVFSVFSPAVGQSLWFAAAYQWGYDGGRMRRWYEGSSRSADGSAAGERRERWFRQRVLAYLPLLLVTAGTYRIVVGAPVHAHKVLRMLVTGPNLIHFGVMLAAFALGVRAQSERFGARDHLRDALYGPTRWLFPAAIAALSIGAAAYDATLALGAVLIVSCAMIAWTRQPMFLTRRGIAAWAILGEEAR